MSFCLLMQATSNLKGHIWAERDKNHEKPKYIQHLLFLKKDKVKDDKAPLYARITVNGDYKDISTKRWVKISAWNQKAQKISGKSEEDIIVKEKIRLLTNQINTAYDQLRHERQILTAETIKAKTEGTEVEPHTINFLMNYHNVDLKQLIEEGTLKNYRSTERFIQEFLIKKKKKRDIVGVFLYYKSKFIPG